MAPTATLLSFRLGGSDGVAVEARKWGTALGELGFEVRRVAGEFSGPGEPDDEIIPGLALESGAGAPPMETVAAALEGSDLVVVENICSLPVNPEASRAVGTALRGHRGRVVFHHHDLAWQRPAFRRFEHEVPPHIPGALHVAINHRSRRELHARGFEGAVTIHNRFDLDAPPASPQQRDETRAAFGFAADDVVLLQPARAIERKNVPGGVRFATELQRAMPDQVVRYWLSGPAEDGYAATLERVRERSAVPTTVGRAPSAAHAYGASDAVVFPSTWEGFGNPTIESIAARRPLAVYRYPVLGEISAYGLRYFDVDDAGAGALARFLREPEARLLDTNLRRARINFSITDLPATIESAFMAHGWLAW